MSIVLWGESKEEERLKEIRRGLLCMQRQQLLASGEIHVCTGAYESFYGSREFRQAELIFVYFAEPGEDFCRFFISHRRYTQKTVFLFGQSYGCFDSGKLRDYYRVSEKEYVMVPGRRDYFYEAGIKQLLCLIRKNRERQELFTA